MRASRIMILVALTSIAVPLACPGQMAASQTLPPGLETTAGGSTSSWPFSTTSDQKWQWVFDTGLFVFPGPITLQEISLRLSSAAANAGASFPSVTVTLASSPNDYLLNGAPPFGQDPIFANNLGSDATVVRLGPWVTGPVPASGGTTGSWIPLGITPGFTFDPTLGQDLVIQIEKCGTTTPFSTTFDLASTAPGLLGANRYGDIASCATAARNNSANEAVLVIRIDYTLPAPTWQLNQPAATLVFDNGISTGFGPIVASRGVGQSVPISWTSTLVGQPFDIGLGTVPGVPLGGGALATAGGQILNLDFGDPGLLFLFGLQFTAPFIPLNVSVSFPAPTTLSAQLVVIDPLQPDGLALSALNTLLVL